MTRDPRLRRLSAEHHRALVFARDVARRAFAVPADPSLGPALRAHFERELEPHFRVEEALLLPALRLLGGGDLALRVEREHGSMRLFVAAAGGGDRGAAATFAALLHEHVRFEERELFPWCEARLPADVLAAVDRAGLENDVTASYEFG